MTAVIYGSTTGNTESVASEICKRIGEEQTELINISDLSTDSLSRYENLLLGASTWGVGDLQDDWEIGLELFKGADLSGKRIGFFGCGDQDGFSDSFVDSLGIIYEAIKDSGAIFIGSFPTDGYSFSDSKALIDGAFIGLPIDEDCQSNMTKERIDNWVTSLGI